MNKTNKQPNRLLSCILAFVLIAALALCSVGCNDNGEKESPETPTNTVTDNGTAEGGSSENGTADDATASDITVKGSGATVFYFNVVDGDGNIQKFEIHTDKTVVGEALLSLGLIEGEDGPYGLYVKKVNGIIADYDTNGTYWAFYVGDEYGMTGVDLTEITPGATYAFKVSK